MSGANAVSVRSNGKLVVAALGVTAEMEKIPVGLREGDTENSEVMTHAKGLIAALGAKPLVAQAA